MDNLALSFYASEPKIKGMKPFLIGITGGTAAGKTETIERLQEIFGPKITVISQDNYYLDLEKLGEERWERANFDQPSAIDNKLFVKHLKALIKGKAVQIPVYDFKTHSRKKERIKVGPAPIIIVEGIFVLAIKEIRRLLDLKVFLDADADVRLARRLLRDIYTRGLSVKELAQNLQWYLEVVKPQQEKWVLPTKKYADLVLDTNEGVRKAVKKLAEIIRKKLHAFDSG